MASLRVRQRKDGSSYTAVLYTLDGKQTSSSFNDHREAVAFQQLVNRVGPAKALERHRDRWEEGFSRLMQYVERHGDARIPRSYKVDGYRLGGWVSNLRSFYSRGTLGADRRRQLEDLPGWTFDTVADRCEEGFTRLVQYVERHGDARVPQSYEIDGYRLGSWVTMQRTRHAKGVLDADRERRLQNLRGWTWNPKGDQWEEGFCRLVDYVRCHGDARVPWTVEVDGYPLGKWVREQRNRHSKGILTPTDATDSKA